MSERFSMTATNPRSLVLVKMKHGLLCKSVELPIMAAPSSEKARGTILGMKRDYRSPALLIPIIPATLLPSLAMFASNSGMGHTSQPAGGCLGGVFSFRYDFGMIAAEAKGVLK
jgi:hypothetical protein